MERNVHGEGSLGETFERKLTIHGYDWDDVDWGNEWGLIYSRTGNEI